MDNVSSCQETGKAFSSEVPFYYKFQSPWGSVSYHLRLPLMTHPATLITMPIQVSYYYFGDIFRKAMKPIRGIEVAGGNQLSRTRALK